MKKIKNIFYVLLIIFTLPIVCKAASGTVSVSGTNNVVVNNKVTITVNLSSSTPIGSWQMQLDYDKKYLQLTSSSAEAGGTVMAASSASGVKSKKYTFTFKALKTGSTKISIDSYEAYAFTDLSEISLTSSSKTLKIITQEELEASYSKDNDLKSLSVEGYTISPSFSKDNLNYSVVVPEGTTSVNVVATPNDSKSTVSGSGTVTVSEGTNNISIVVRAENGSEKTYNLLVEVVDEHPINVKIANKDYTVIKLRSNYTCPELFQESEIDINDVKIPACVNDKVKYTLVGLKDSEGNVINAIYENGKYSEYNEVTGTSLKIIILDSDVTLPGMEKANSMIDGKTYAANMYENNSKYLVIYGMNVATGEKDFYLYDTTNKTFTLYNDEQVKDLIKSNELYSYVIIAFGIALILSFVIILKLNKKCQKPKVKEVTKSEEVKKESKVKAKNTKEKEIKEEVKKEEKEEKENNILLDNEDETETYYLFEKDRKKNKKKK